MSGLNLGDIDAGTVLNFKWNTYNASGASAARGTKGTMSIYKDNLTTQSTAGITDTEGFDSITGLQHCTIDTSADGTFYAAGSDFDVVLLGGVVDSQTVNPVVAHFSIRHGRSAIMPTTTGRTLDVSATGEAGVDWANIGSPTTVQDLSGTKINTTDNAVPATLAASQPNYAPSKAGDAMALTAAYDAAKTASTQTSVDSVKAKTDQLHFTGSSGVEKVNSQVAGVNTDAIDAASIKADAVTKIQTGLGTSANQQTILDRLGAFTGTGINTVLGFLKAIASKSAATPSDIGGTYDASSDALEAISDKPSSGLTAADVWNYLVSALGATTTIGGYLKSVLTALQNAVSGTTTFVRSPVDSDGTTFMRQGVSYTGDYALHYTNTSTRDLLAAGLTVKLQFAGYSYTGVITGSIGVWNIDVPVDGTDNASIPTGIYPGELAVFVGSSEVPELASFSVEIAINP